MAIELRAGRLSALLEDGGLRGVRWDGIEVLRRAAFLLRDEDWGTVPASVELVNQRSDGQAFDLELRLRHRHRGVGLDTHIRIRGGAEGRLELTAVSEAEADLATNRCGLVVLHPAHFAGLPLEVLHADGSRESSAFPLLISPAQPVLSIRALRCQPADGIEVDCRLEADLPHDPLGKFEMEDQRNWSDASFKTYVCSLLDPWPYRLEAGKAYRQAMVLTIVASPAFGEGKASALVPGLASRQPASTPPLIAVGAPLGLRMPALGLGVAAAAESCSSAERQAVLALAPGWLLGECDLRAADPLAHLQAIAALARASGARLRLDLLAADHWNADQAAEQAASACARAGVRPDAVRILPAALLQSFQPGDHWPAVPRPSDYSAALRKAFPAVQVGGGVFTYFTELNRLAPPAEGLDFIGHATCPIVHAADDDAVMETLESLPHIARSVAAGWPGLPWQLGPSTLAASRNPYGSATLANPEWRSLPLADRDPRLCTDFGAAWTAGYAAAVIPHSPALLALHFTHGHCGPMPRGDGQCAPAWNVLRVLALAQGRPLLQLPGLPPTLRAIAWEHAPGLARLLLANLGPAAGSLALPGEVRLVHLHQPRGPAQDLAPRPCADAILQLAPRQVVLVELVSAPAT